MDPRGDRKTQVEKATFNPLPSPLLPSPPPVLRPTDRQVGCPGPRSMEPMKKEQGEHGQTRAQGCSGSWSLVSCAAALFSPSPQSCGSSGLPAAIFFPLTAHQGPRLFSATVYLNSIRNYYNCISPERNGKENKTFKDAKVCGRGRKRKWI
ncbi:uncharacterized protein BO95DRAFT_271662 [Aspergillus brunneoviolaceus CBS 621.78]|uniref:Uncharacterized protein n=1 Tax=Aspergillus brunneoviolaceus CBS 621.78 TaxID=1450534 RepID=A0ACD1FWJ7_9EURO|nr:hypothetical protein BO95DRAFT_271662 [Aspergillus brunneoviolaceus CBS 621.78]RAH41349.1 hypothetical protein BO95DRAFT_271662 [Aspergillus brunneoviolaceus CBS 621.78]